MAKKMYDIVPPNSSPKPLPIIKATKKVSRPKKPVVRIVEESFAPPAQKKATATGGVPSEGGKKRFPLREILVGSAVLVFLLVAYGVMKLPKADIMIWPKTETLTLSQKITADISAKVVNVDTNVIPARYLEETKDSWQEFQATGSGSNDGKATGTIRVYNKTDSSFGLVKGTHFLSDSGKYFVTLAKVTIPAMKNKTPGYVDAQVQAEESGVEYNIKPSKFSAPKLYGTVYYYSIYGESSNSMTGGKTGTVKKVTDDDILQAKDSLTKKLLQDARDVLKGKLASDEVLLDGAIETMVIEAKSDIKAGTVVDKFTESAKVKVSALVIKKQDAEQLVKKNITSQLADFNSFLENSLDVKYNPGALDLKKGIMVLNSTSSVKTYYDMDRNKLVNLFSTKDSDQIKGIVDQMYTDKVSELKVNFWPFWVHKAPSDKNRIKVNVLFDK